MDTKSLKKISKHKKTKENKHKSSKKKSEKQLVNEISSFIKQNMKKAEKNKDKELTEKEYNVIIKQLDAIEQYLREYRENLDMRSKKYNYTTKTLNYIVNLKTSKITWGKIFKATVKFMIFLIAMAFVLKISYKFIRFII